MSRLQIRRRQRQIAKMTATEGVRIVPTMLTTQQGPASECLKLTNQLRFG